MTFLRQKLVKMDCKGLFSCLLTVAMGNNQGLSGRYFQLRDGSGSGIAKNFGFGFGYGSGTGICTIYLINRVLSGNKNIDRFFFRVYQYGIFFLNIWMLFEYKTFLKSIHIDSMFTYLDFL